VTKSGPRFARDFTSAQQRFRAAVATVGGHIESHVHPLRGPDGEALATDVARFGSQKARELLILISGVHGVEHYPGSACMVSWLESGAAARLPDNVAVLLIHAINPWGAAHYRRYTEGNVDLARNFVNFDRPLPVHRKYDIIHEAISSADRNRVAASLSQLFAELGERDAIEALMGGQYAFPDGFSFGGQKAQWSNIQLRDILSKHAVDAEAVTVIEYHSGLGPFGYGMPVTMQTGSGLERVRNLFGPDVVAPRAGEGLHSAPGHTSDGYAEALPDSCLTSIVLEYGTYPPDVSLPVLLDDHWVTHHGNPDSAEGRAIKQRNLEMHCPDDPKWEDAVLKRSGEIIGMAFAGMENCK